MMKVEARPLISTFSRMLADSRGQGLLEYALIIGLVSIVAIAALSALGGKTNNTLLAPAASAMPG
jgi:Flp pilus assembly pilin Flp